MTLVSPLRSSVCRTPVASTVVVNDPPCGKGGVRTTSLSFPVRRLPFSGILIFIHHAHWRAFMGYDMYWRTPDPDERAAVEAARAEMNSNDGWQVLPGECQAA